MKLRLAWLILGAFVLILPAAQPLRAAPEGENAASLIRSLSDVDPAVREQAADRLVRMGEAVREEIIAAAHSDDPEIASRAGQVLLRLPWSRPGDSAAATRILKGYGTADERRRMRNVEDLARQNEWDVLLRLLLEDPSDAVRWTVVRRLKGVADEDVIARMREVDATSDNIPVLTLAGRIWFSRDRDKGIALLRRAVELERSHPAADWGELDFAFDFLTRAAVAGGKLDEAADLLRRQAARQYDGHTAPAAAVQLFALHACAAAPIEGFERDLSVYGPLLDRPNALDAAVLFYRRLGFTVPPLASLAYAATELTFEQRFAGADFLLAQGFHGAAADELRRTIALATQKPDLRAHPGEKHRVVANALFRLAHIAAEIGDDQAAADHLTAAMKRKDTAGYSLDGAVEEDVWAEIHARSLKAALKRGDPEAAREHAKKLAPLTPTNSDLALSALDALNAHGAEKQAAELFERAYARMKAQVNAEPNNPQLLNNLAWLCARHGKRLDEALEFANRALAADPDNPALLDTAAEANFRLGKIDEAIRLETRALELRPDEKFMAEQLERFRAAKKP